MLVIFICALFAFVSTAPKTHYAEDSAAELFEEFIRNYDRKYQNEIEKTKRFQIFKENIIEINRLNSLGDVVFGINNFTDISDEEFSKNYMGLSEISSRRMYDFNNCKVIRDEDVTTRSAPEFLDYREMNAVTDVKNQYACGSCWIFAAIGAIESNFALKYGILLKFSEQQLLDCLECSTGDGCSPGGRQSIALSELSTSAFGVMLEYDNPYVAVRKQCLYDPTKLQVKVAGCYYYNLNDEANLKEVLYKNGPIAILMNGKAAQLYQGGIYTVDYCPPYIPSDGGHAALLIGYGTDNGRDYWLVKNSWGNTWGEGGYMRISRGFNTCALMSPGAASAIVA